MSAPQSEKEDNASAWRARREGERAARSRARAARAWRALSAGTARGARNDLAGHTSPPERLELSTTPESHHGLGDPATQRRNLGPCGGSVASAASPCVGRTCATRSARHTAADSAPNDASARRRPRQHHLCRFFSDRGARGTIHDAGRRSGYLARGGAKWSRVGESNFGDAALDIALSVKSRQAQITTLCGPIRAPSGSRLFSRTRIHAVTAASDSDARGAPHSARIRYAST